MKAFALKFVRKDKIDEHLALGWMGAQPNAAHHHLSYGIEMKWVCPCPVPGGFQAPVEPAAFHEISQERAHERATDGP